VYLSSLYANISLHRKVFRIEECAMTIERFDTFRRTASGLSLCYKNGFSTHGNCRRMLRRTLQAVYAGELVLGGGGGGGSSSGTSSSSSSNLLNETF
jgi:hypothetical protein